MFYARERELKKLRKEVAGTRKTAVLVYGKRRVGKSTLIAEAAKAFDGVVINHLCARSSYQGNLTLLCRSIALSLGLPNFTLPTLADVFDFLAAQGRQMLVVIDEYQYFKESLKVGELDSLMQTVIDQLPDNVKLVLCGSYVTVMRELLEEDNPLFGRFTSIIHLEDMDYLDAQCFYPQLSPNEKIAFYAVFGGSPFVLSSLDVDAPLEDNIKSMLLEENSVLRTHVESVMLAELRRSFDVRILEALGNGRKRYTDIESHVGGGGGLLDKQLKNLLNMETIRKVRPINRKEDRRKTFYEIQDNLMRFYYAYLFANGGAVGRIGEEAFFQTYVATNLLTYVSLRFEAIVSQYFTRLARAGGLPGIEDIGTFWYDDSRSHTSGQFDCVLRRNGSYEFYEAKYSYRPMSLAACRQEEVRVRAIPCLDDACVGFVCSAGFEIDSDVGRLISGEDLYDLTQQWGPSEKTGEMRATNNTKESSRSRDGMCDSAIVTFDDSAKT